MYVCILWSTAPYHTCLSSRGEGCTWLTAMCDTAGPGTTLTMRGAITEGPHRGAMGAIGPMGPAITAGPSRLGDGPGAGAGAGAAAARLRRATKTHCSRRNKINSDYIRLEPCATYQLEHFVLSMVCNDLICQCTASWPIYTENNCKLLQLDAVHR